MNLSNLNLCRPLAAVDAESTGLDPLTDRVVEVAAVIFSPAGGASTFHTRVNPGRPIPAAATAVHGIGDADVADAPPFAAVAGELARRLDGCDLCGFGLAGFDLPLLTREFARAGVPFRVGGRAVLDALAVYHRHEPRDLSAAVAFYTGLTHAGAHDALVDARAAAGVLDRQVARYGLPAVPEALHAALVEVDVAGKFRRDAAGRPAFAFGKHLGRPLADVARTDRGYLEWVLTRGFLDDVHELVRRALADAAGR